MLHGTSGVPDNQVTEAIQNGICKVNYATDLRIAYTRGIKSFLNANHGAYDPKKYGQFGINEVERYVIQKMNLIGSCGHV